MKNKATKRRRATRQLKGNRLVGMCEDALKNKVSRARRFGLDESKLVRAAVQFALPALLEGRLILVNGELVPATLAPTPQPAEALKPTGTQG